MKEIPEPDFSPGFTHFYAVMKRDVMPQDPDGRFLEWIAKTCGYWEDLEKLVAYWEAQEAK